MLSPESAQEEATARQTAGEIGDCPRFSDQPLPKDLAALKCLWDGGRPVRDFEINAVMLGKEWLLVMMAGEVLAGYGLRLDKAAPRRHTMVCGLTSAYLGYIGTDRGYSLLVRDPSSSKGCRDCSAKRFRDSRSEMLFALGPGAAALGDAFHQVRAPRRGRHERRDVHVRDREMKKPIVIIAAMICFLAGGTIPCKTDRHTQHNHFTGSDVTKYQAVPGNLGADGTAAIARDGAAMSPTTNETAGGRGGGRGGLCGSAMNVSARSGLGNTMAGKRPDPAVIEQKRCLPTSGAGVESPERPTTVARRRLSGKPRKKTFAERRELERIIGKARRSRGPESVWDTEAAAKRDPGSGKPTS